MVSCADMKSNKPKKTIEVCIVNGVEGLSVSINNIRVAGNKPWGGGKILLAVQVPISKIKNAIK